MIDLPQLRRHGLPGQGQPRQGSEEPITEVGSAELGWSAADELAALETVWDSLCQDVESPTPSLQLPTIVATPSLAPIGGQRSQRQRLRPAEAPGRLAPEQFLVLSQSFVVKECMDLSRGA